MKKLVAVLGSTRKGSSSARIAEEIIKAAEEKGYETVFYYPGTMKMKGCLGCGLCKQIETDCVITDDMQDYFEDLHECDALLLTAPNYYGQPAGHMITFLNRHFCLTGADRKTRLDHKIPLITVFSQGAPDTTESYQAVYDRYVSMFEGMGMESAGSITVGRNSDLSEDGPVMTKARALGSAL